MRRGLHAVLLGLALVLAPAVQTQMEEGPDVPRRSDVPAPGDVTGAVGHRESLAIDALLSSISRTFVENLGQVDNPDVRFYASGDPLSVGLTTRGVVFTLFETPCAGLDPLCPDRPSPRRSVTFSMVFDGCAVVEPTGQMPLGFPSSFFKGGSPDMWVSGAESYEEVWYEDLYDGVDLRFYFKDGQLKYDLILDAGADPDAIALRYSGIEGLGVDPASGDLLIRTRVGTVRDSRPVISQEGVAPREGSPGSYRLEGRYSCRFCIPSRFSPDGPMVIDPGLQYSTLLGGSNAESPYQIATDAAGYVYVTGYTTSPAFPSTPDAFDPDGNATVDDIDTFIVKLDPDLTNLSFATFLGGSEIQGPSGLQLVDDGIFVVGFTQSGDYPVTDDALDGSFNGHDDVFVSKLDRTGSDLLYSTYIGGTRHDMARAIHVSATGEVYVAGETISDNFPTTPGAYCETFDRRADSDGAFFALRLDSSLSSLDFSTFVPGFDIVGSVWPSLVQKVDASGNVILVGTTASRDCDITPNAMYPYNNGSEEVYLAKLDPSCSDLLYSTYLGGSAREIVESAALGPDGTLYILGWTHSTDFPTTPDAHSRTNGGNVDTFLAALDSSLGTMTYGSYYGGSGSDGGKNCHLDPQLGVLYFGGSTYSMNLPTTKGCYDSVKPPDDVLSDGFLMGVSTADFDLTYCTYLGGSGREDIKFISANRGTNLSIVGFTTSRDFPMTEGAFDSTANGDWDIFVVVLDPTPCDLPDPPSNVRVNVGDGNVTISWDPPPDQGCRILEHIVYKGESPGNLKLEKWLPFPENSTIDEEVTNGIEYHYAVSAVNSMGEGPRSDPLMAKPLGCPGPPLGLRCHSDNGSVHLGWHAPIITGGEVAGYNILRGSSQETMYPLTSTNDTTFVDDYVSSWARYYYGVEAYNALHTGERVVTGVTNLGPPYDISITASDSRVELTWTIPQHAKDTVFSGYRLYRGTSPEDAYLFKEVASATFELIDYGLRNGQLYYYYLTSFDEKGESVRSEMLMATPYGKPLPPENLTAGAGDTHVVLDWDPPSSDNGRPVTSFNVYGGDGRSDLELLKTVAGETTFNHTGLINGVEYFYRVTAMNKAGESSVTDTVSATPRGRPGSVGRVTIEESAFGGAYLSWSYPSDDGGAETLSFQVLRGTSPDALSLVAEVTQLTEYLDRSIEEKVTYYYAIVANSSVGTGPPSDVVNITLRTVPGPVEDLLWKVGDGYVQLNWSHPLDDGASPLQGYVVVRETLGGVDPHTTGLDLVLGFNDTSVTNGRTYYYTVKAFNAVGDGPEGAQVEATPLGMVGPPDQPTATLKGKDIVLTWSPPSTDGRVPATGYRVLRGTSPDDLAEIAKVGDVATYVDPDIDRGPVYYYRIVPISTYGEGPPTDVSVDTAEPTTGARSNAAYILSGILLLAIVLGGVVMAVRSRRARAAMATDAGAVGGAPPSAVEGPSSYVVEEVFVVYADGRLIAHHAREDFKVLDLDLMSSMLIAIQGIIQDGIDRGGELQSIKYAEINIVMEMGRHLVLAAVIYGKAGPRLQEMLSLTLEIVEDQYGEVAEDWDGDLSAFEGIESSIATLVDSTSNLTRADIGKVVAAEGVSLASAVDFHRGYVRLRVAAINGSDEMIADATLEMRYNRDMLRLERVEPSEYKRVGDKVSLGNISPGERTAIALLLDPQICQGTFIDGSLMYYDSGGNVQRVEMKRRSADVVCPIFFTKEHINTAMLRRLIKDKLHQSDFRSFRYPVTIAPGEMFRLAKAALGGGEIQLVREYVEEGTPYEAEAWFYGETKVKGYRIAMRIGVDEAKGVLVFFAASSDMKPITGLLAEFYREVNRAVKEQYPDAPPMTTEADEGPDADRERRETFIERLDGQ